MAKKKKRKKDVLKRLAKRRGERSRRKKKVTRPKAVASPVPGREEEVKEALNGSANLVFAEELADIHFTSEGLTSYLEEVRKRENVEPEEFVREGVSQLSTPDFLSKVKERVAVIGASGPQTDPQRISSSVVVRALEAGIPPSAIPFFAALFVRDVKDHPLSDDAAIWKLVYPFLPSRILAPEKPQEEKNKEYPHIILPHSPE